MTFTIFTDGSSNLPGSILTQHSICLVPCTYILEDNPVVYSGNVDEFDYVTYYRRLREGSKVSTSLINTHQFAESFRPALERGEDILYVGMSSGISGTLQAARIAAEELAEEFPDRVIRVVDSMGAGLGTGLLTCKADDYRRQGLSVEETGLRLEQDRMNLCEYFIVDDLMFLRRTGRISTAVAALGSVLNIKPMLRGDEEGHISSCAKCRGRKKAMEEFVKRYSAKVRDAENQVIGISHGSCPEEAEVLAEMIRAAAAPKDILIVPHEPFTGAHAGPGMLGLFFFGDGR